MLYKRDHLWLLRKTQNMENTGIFWVSMLTLHLIVINQQIGTGHVRTLRI